jgi:hypothetical protein
MTKKFPQVLLVGNGINRAYGGGSWGDLLHDIATEDMKKYLESGKEMTTPMPLRAILLTHDNIDQSLKNYNKAKLFGSVSETTHREYLQKILAMGFDHILTTNYSYELETAALGKAATTITENQLRSMQAHSHYVKKAEPKYLLHTYNSCIFNGIENNIWHIHGESRKSDSMVLGHYYYGELLYKIKNYVANKSRRYFFNERDNVETHIRSWIDAFILGDVYVLGYGFDIAEIDLWWLLNRKFKEKADHGSVYFFEPKVHSENGEIDEKLELLKVFVGQDNCFDLGKEYYDWRKYNTQEYNEEYATHNKEMYPKFYAEAVDKIADLMRN